MLAGSVGTCGEAFTSILQVLRGLKGASVKNSPMYWVVEIVEHESAKVIDTWKRKLDRAAGLEAKSEQS